MVCPLFIFIECPLSVGVLWSCRCSGSCSHVFMITDALFYFIFFFSNREYLSFFFLSVT